VFRLESVLSASKQNLLLWILCCGFFLLPFARLQIFYHDFVFTKWILVYSLAFFGIGCYVGKDQILKLPKLQKSLILFFFGFIVYFLLNLFLFDLSLFSTSFVDRFIFIVLTILFYNFFLSNTLRIDFIFAALLFSISVFIAFSFFEYFSLDKEFRYLSGVSFGNINLAAEFVGINIVLLVLGQNQLNKFGSWRDAVIGLSLLFVYVSACRSVIIALLVTSIVLVALRILTLRIFVKYGLIFLFFLSLFHVATILDITKNEVHQVVFTDESSVEGVKTSKEVTTKIRWQMYLGTLRMIWDHPFGCGPGHFTFGFMPYLVATMPEFNQMMVPQSPHSEYLRILSEEGIFFFCLCLILLILFLTKNKSFFLKIKQNHPFIIGFFLFLSIQALFQFPLMNPFPFLISACMLGYLLSILYKENVISVNSSGSLFLSVFSFILAFALILSEFLIFAYPKSTNANHLASFLNANNWYAAIQEIEAYLAKNDLQSAKKSLEKELTRRPNNYLALALSANIAGREGNKGKMCHDLERIDAFFGGQSSYHPFLKEQCRSF
jgi:hypothetical protein